MTNEEAIAYFKRHIDLYCVDGICREAEEMAIKALEQQPIPDNATNGDVIDAMFPNVDFVTDVLGGFNFPKWWWNAPYQKGGKE